MQRNFAQDFPSLKFSHITEREGLSNNFVRWVTQDKDGFIWVATNDGLDRLDGYRIKKFYHNPEDSNSLVNNEVTGIVADSKSNLWISTLAGISCYNPVKQFFSNFQQTGNAGKRIVSDYTNPPFFDEVNKQVYMPVRNALYIFDEDLKFTEIPVHAASIPGIDTNATVEYYRIYEDREQQLWALYKNYILRLNKQTRKVEEIFSTPEADIRCMFEDDARNIWLGTYGRGLFMLDPVTKAVKKISLDSAIYIVQSICEWKDKTNHAWIVAGTNVGLVLIDPQTMKNKFYGSDAFNNYSLLRGNINSMFVDKQNILWIGTENGLSYLEPSKQLFEAWSILTPDEKIRIGENDYAYSFFEDSGKYWSSNWSNTGLLCYNGNGELIRTIGNLCPRESLQTQGYTNRAYGFAKLANGNYLISADAGLCEYSVKDNTSQLYTAKADYNPLGLRNIVQYDDSTYWIRTRNNGNNGIFVYNSVRKKFVAHYASDCNDCLPSNLFDMLITKDKNIYTTPDNHYLYVFDKRKNAFVPFFTSKEQTAKIPSSSFECMAEDKSGNVWIGTPKGLLELDVRNKQIIKDYSQDKKLGGIEIEKLCFDDSDNLWMNTERGLFCLTADRNRLFNFNMGDGLPDNSLSGFLYKGANGYLYAGALGYIVKFKPEELLHQKTSAAVHFSEFTVMNKPYSISIDNNEKRLYLKPGENIFTADFSILNYDNAAGNRFYYKLDGVMNEWKENENGHLSFYNLPAGTYTLHVKGGDKYGNEFPGEASVTIEVTPYWWQTTWFYALLVLFTGVLLYLLVIRRIKNIRKESLFKAKIAETEMIALRAQMNPHFIFNCMNIIDGLITENRKEEAKDFLQKFSRLIRLVLENSQHQLVPLSSDLKTIELYTEMEAIRYNHKFTYQFDIAKELIEDNYKIPPLLLQPYIENAIIHGLRHKENGMGKLLVSMQIANGNLIVCIEDNGVGRKKAAAINKENRKPHQQLGMKVTEKRIELLKAISPSDIEFSITDVTSEEETGTRVQLILPLEFNFDTN